MENKKMISVIRYTGQTSLERLIPAKRWAACSDIFWILTSQVEVLVRAKATEIISLPLRGCISVGGLILIVTGIAREVEEMDLVSNLNHCSGEQIGPL